MSVTATVSPRPGLFPEGTAVEAFPLTATNLERVEERVPIPAPTATGVIASGKVELAGLTKEVMYVLEGVVDEVQTITVKATKGKFKIKFEGKETAAIKYNATAKEVEEALEALENVAVGDVEVTGGPGDATGTKPYVVKFLKAWAGTNVGAMTTIVTELEEGTKTATVATTTQGSKGGPGGTQVTCMFQAPES
jgi:hypothetical protein